MSKISVLQASKDFKVTRKTLYNWINQGKITKTPEGLLDTNDIARLCNEKRSKQPTIHKDTAQIDSNYTSIQLENNQLKQQLALYELEINQLRNQVIYLREQEQWLKSQIEQQKLLEMHNNKKGFLSKFFK